MGRALMLTQEVHAKLVEAVSTGCKYEDAYLYAGVSESTFYRWMNRGRTESDRRKTGLEPIEEEEPYCLLWDDLRREEGTLAVFAMGNWKLAMARDWKAAQAFMRLRFPHWRGTEDPESIMELLGEQEARLARQQGQLVAQAFQQLVDGLGLTAEQRAKFPAVARGVLLGLPAAPDPPTSEVIEADATEAPAKKPRPRTPKKPAAKTPPKPRAKTAPKGSTKKPARKT